MANATTARPRYRVPEIQPECESVSLDDFDLDDIRAYLRHQGDAIASDCANTGDGDGLFICQDDLDKAETLSLCGQREQAREWILSMVSERIGRPL